MKLAANRQIYEYWNSLRGERSSPERGDIDPAAIRGVLADTFILEVDDQKTYPFRLAGTRTNAIFTRELKGHSFLSLWRDSERLEIEGVLAGVCDDVLGAVAGVEAIFAGRDPMILELLLLPVRYFGKTHARMLGCLSPAALPRWTGLIPPDHLRLTGLRILTPILAPRDNAAAVSFAQSPMTAANADAPRPNRRGHLLVYEGGATAESRTRQDNGPLRDIG